jgi:hypothetical protein
MIKLNYNLDIFCKKCMTDIPISIVNKDFISTEEERSLGYETEHEYERYMKCPNCGNDITVGIHVYEYPKDYINCSLVFGSGYFKDEVLKKIDNINKV